MTDSLVFFVPGLPATAGSKRAYPIRRPGGSLGVTVAPACRGQKAWQAVVSADAASAATKQGWHLASGPLAVELTFRIPRPKKHFGRGRGAGQVKPSAPAWPDRRPDVDKLCRAVMDSLSRVVWLDDSQVTTLSARKIFANVAWPVGVQITIRPAGPPPAIPSD